MNEPMPKTTEELIEYIRNHKLVPKQLHIYDCDEGFEVAGITLGNEWYEKGKKWIYNHSSGPITKNIYTRPGYFISPK